MTAFHQQMSAWAELEDVPAGSFQSRYSSKQGTVELHHQALVFTLSMAPETQPRKTSTQLTSLRTNLRTEVLAKIGERQDC